MVEHDGQVGQLLKKLDDLGIANNTIVIYTTDNGAETFSWPDGGTTPFRGEKNTNWEGGYRVPAMVRWPGLVPPRTEINEIFSAEDWATTLVAAAGEPDIKNKLLQGYDAAGKNFKVHLDGYDQRDLSPARARTSAANSSTGPMTATLPAFDTSSGRRCSWSKRPKGSVSGQQPMVQLRLPMLFNLRSDPFERAQHEVRRLRPLVHRARLCARPGAVDRGAASREFPAVPTAPTAGLILGRAGHGETQEPPVQQLAMIAAYQKEATMLPIISSDIDRRTLLSALALLPALSVPLLTAPASAQTTTSSGALPSWNEGPAKQAILDFVRDTTGPGSPKFVPPEQRIATFDQDGTLWVEHPIYSQVVYCLDRVPALVEKDPKLKDVEPFKTVLSGNREAIAKLSLHDLEKVLFATLTGMSVDEFDAEARKWLTSAKDGRWKRPYTDLIYQPMLEVMQYLRSSGYRTYIVTGGGQDFVRVYSDRVYGIPPEQVVGTAAGTSSDTRRTVRRS